MKIQFKTEKQIDPTKNDGFEVNYAPAKRLAFKIRWFMLVMLIVSPLLFFGWHILSKEVLITAGGILTTEPIVLHTSQSVFIKSIDVKEGDTVEEQQVLIQLSSPEIENELSLLEKNHRRVKQRYQDGFVNLRALYDKEIETLQENIEAQESITDRFKSYGDRGMLGIDEQLMLEESIASSESDYQKALIGLEEATLNHKVMLRATLIDIELALSSARAKYSQLTIKAPKGAEINNIFVKQGEFLSEGDPLISLSNLPESIVNVYLSPEQMDYTGIGQTATITLPNGDTYQGIIEKPTQMTGRLPALFSGPFGGAKAAIKVTLTIKPKLELQLEGLPVEVRFHYM